jgi:hypothetical protein
VKTLERGITAITAAAGKPLARTSEELAENVPASSETKFVEDARKIEVAENVLLTEPSPEPFRAERVVLFSLFLIAQDRISFIDFLELGLGRLVTLVPVGVILHGQLAVGFLDFFLSRGSRDFENLVVVFALHRALKIRWICFYIKILITCAGQVKEELTFNLKPYFSRRSVFTIFHHSTIPSPRPYFLVELIDVFR